MTAVARNVLALAVLVMSSSALAGETWAQGRIVLYTCDFGTHSFAQVELSYRNYSLPWGTSVSLIQGWGGPDNGIGVPFDWENTQTLPVYASAPYTWSTTVQSTISNRSSPKRYEHVDFVWKVRLPDGSEFYEKGNTSTWGYYAANLLDVGERPCTTGSPEVGPLYPLTVTSIEKW